MKKYLFILRKNSRLLIDHVKKHKIAFLLLFGLLIRMILMPFFAWEDIISTYQRAYEVAFNGVSLFKYGQIFSHLIEVVNLRIYDILFNRDNLLPLTRFKSENPYINLNLFFFKLPYLLFDILSFFILKKLTKHSKCQVKCLIFYFLNPLLIYAVYIFGRYETFPIALCLLSIYFIKKEKDILSTIPFGLAILSRTSFIILAPIYISLIGKNLKQKILILLLSLSPIFIIVLYKTIFMNNSNELNWLLDGKHVNYIFGSSIETGHGSRIYPFIISYIILSYFSFKDWLRNKSQWEKVALYFCLTFALYFSTSIFHPQYLAWIIPFTSITLLGEMNKREIFIIYMIISIALIPLLLFWENCLLFGLTYPINDHLGSIDLFNYIARYYDPFKLSNIAKSFISACYFIQIYKLIQNLKTRE